MKTLLILMLTATSTAFSQVIVDTFEDIDTAFIDDGLAFGPDNYLYGAHFNGSRVYRIAPNGTVTTFVEGFNTPNGLAFDSNGNLFVADHVGNAVFKVSPSGVVIDTISPIPQPSGILKSYDSDTMIVTRYAANLLLKIAPNGTIDTLSIGGMLNGPVGLDYDDANNLFVANFNDRKVIRIAPNGSQSLFAQFPGPGWLGFMCYGNGTFYGTGYDSQKVFQIRQSDTLISVLAGSSIGEVDGDTSVAKFNRPNGIVLTSNNDTLFVSAYGTGNVRRIVGFVDFAELTSLSLNAHDFTISPNPASDNVQITFRVKKSVQLNIALYDELGQKHYDVLYNAAEGVNSLKITCSELPAGVYFLELTDGSTQILKKLVISH